MGSSKTVKVIDLRENKKEQNFLNKNPGYLLTENSRLKSRVLFEGSELVKSEDYIEDFLYKEKNEDKNDYKFRVKRAVLDPWVNKIVSARQALLHSKAHKRELNTEIDFYRGDVDLQNTSAAEFFFDVSENSQIDGIHWVEVNMTNKILLDLEGNPIKKTAADDLEINHRPYFNPISGFNVLDWGEDDDSNLDWVIIYEPVSIRAGDKEPWGYPIYKKDQWRIWTKSFWIIYELEEGYENKTPKYRVVDTGINPTGEVPVVPFYGIKVENNVGNPVAYSVLDHIILIFNKDSDLDWFERLASHPIPYTIGPLKPSKIDASKGIHLQVTETINSASIGYLETSGTGFASLKDSIQDLRYRIFSVMLNQAKKDSAQVQSADSQREDRRIFATSLKSMAQSHEHSEQRCWKLFYKWMKELKTLNNEVAEIEYNKDFDDSIIEKELIDSLSTLVDKNQYPVDLLFSNLKKGELIPSDMTLEEYKQLLEGDLERSLGLIKNNTFNEDQNNVT